ncbi:hypothetical protein BdWA1_002373 [Babesia duncani]|uniref:Uncharacterized protein n=1 Tax=Babesia duncani TaxID=323732 RepID=A0AAD9PJ13_9APIC|nr:hypothetical protein BdWA1_002373 [Babesia duncani]
MLLSDPEGSIANKIYGDFMDESKKHMSKPKHNKKNHHPHRRRGHLKRRSSFCKLPSCRSTQMHHLGTGSGGYTLGPWDMGPALIQMSPMFGIQTHNDTAAKDEKKMDDSSNEPIENTTEVEKVNYNKTKDQLTTNESNIKQDEKGTNNDGTTVESKQEVPKEAESSDDKSQGVAAETSIESVETKTSEPSTGSYDSNNKEESVKVESSENASELKANESKESAVESIAKIEEPETGADSTVKSESVQENPSSTSEDTEEKESTSKAEADEEEKETETSKKSLEDNKKDEKLSKNNLEAPISEKIEDLKPEASPKINGKPEALIPARTIVDSVVPKCAPLDEDEGATEANKENGVQESSEETKNEADAANKEEDVKDKNEEDNEDFDDEEEDENDSE